MTIKYGSYDGYDGDDYWAFSSLNELCIMHFCRPKRYGGIWLKLFFRLFRL